jgi:hypothetical protein
MINDTGWVGHLDINYPEKTFAAESFDLTELKVEDHEILFSDSASVGINNGDWRLSRESP